MRTLLLILVMLPVACYFAARFLVFLAWVGLQDVGRWIRGRRIIVHGWRKNSKGRYVLKEVDCS